MSVFKNYLFILIFLTVFFQIVSFSEDNDTALSPEYYLILNYADFGPQVVACDLLGFEWWQWESTGSSDPNQKYDIKVIVFKDVSLKIIKRHFPVIPEKEQDYRYVSYKDAVDYLKRAIEEDILEVVTSKLKDTKVRILKYFGADIESSL